MKNASDVFAYSKTIFHTWIETSVFSTFSKHPCEVPKAELRPEDELRTLFALGSTSRTLGMYRTAACGRREVVLAAS